MIRTVLLGVGNSTSALVQGLEYYKTNNSKPGLWHNLVGKYGVSDIELVGAYDINLSLIHISEPTRRYAIWYGGVGV